MLVSATDLSSYLYCPRKLYLQKVLKIREPVKDVMVLGTVRHATYEALGKADEAVVQGFSSHTSYPELLESFKTAYSEALRNAVLRHSPQLAEVDLISGEVFVDAWQHIFAEARQRSREIFDFAASSSVFGAELWERMEPKILPELRIESEALQLKGIVDQILVFESEYVPVELKTGRTPLEGVWPGHRVQVGAYALLVAERFATQVQKGVVRYLDTQQHRDVVMNPFLEMEVKELVRKVLALLGSPDIPPCAEKNRDCEKLFPTEKHY